MKSINYVLKSLFILFVLSSCLKNEDLNNPTLTLISPKENDTLTDSQSEYNIQFKASDDVGLKSETLKITDETGKSLTSEKRNIYGTSYSYTNTFVFGGTPGKITKLYLSIEIEDEGSNITNDVIPFYVKL